MQCNGTHQSMICQMIWDDMIGWHTATQQQGQDDADVKDRNSNGEGNDKMKTMALVGMRMNKQWETMMGLQWAASSQQDTGGCCTSHCWWHFGQENTRERNMLEDEMTEERPRGRLFGGVYRVPWNQFKTHVPPPWSGRRTGTCSACVLGIRLSYWRHD